MAESIGSLALQLTANTAGLASGLASGASMIGGFASKATSALASFAGDALGKAAGGDLLGLAGSLPYIGPFVQAAGAIASPLLRAAASAETAQLRFTALFGSAEKATEALADLRKLSLGGGFSMTELEPAARNLAQAGIAAEFVVPTMKSLAGVSAITGDSVEELAGKIAHIAETGHVSGRELASLGGPVLSQLARNLGVSQEALRHMAEAGTIGPKQILKALGDVTQEGGALAGSLGKRAQTLAGAWAIATEQIQSLVGTLGKTAVAGIGQGFGGGGGLMAGFTGFIDRVKVGIGQLMPVFEFVGKGARYYFAMVGQVWDDFVSPAIQAVIGWVGKLDLSFEDFFNLGTFVFRTQAKAIAYIVDALKLTGGAISSYLIAPFVRFGAASLEVQGQLLEFLGPRLSGGLNSAIRMVWNFSNIMLQGFRFVGQIGAGAFAYIGGAVKTLFADPALKLVDQVVAALQSILEAFAAVGKANGLGIPDWVADLNGGIKDVRRKLGAGIDFKVPSPAEAMAGVGKIADEVGESQDALAKATMELVGNLGKGAGDAAVKLYAVRDSLKDIAKVAGDVGADLLKTTLGDGAKAVDAWFDKVKQRAKENAGKVGAGILGAGGLLAGDLGIAPDQKLDLSGGVKGSSQVNADLAAPDLIGTAAAQSAVAKFQLLQQIGSQNTQPIGRDQGVQLIQAVVDQKGQLEQIKAILRTVAIPAIVGF